MVLSDDPATASTRAVDLLQQHGWRPLAITDAEHGYARGDFDRRPGAAPLFDAAAQWGFGLAVGAPAQVELLSQGFSSPYRDSA